MPRKSRGNLLLMRVCSAMAIFFAGTKLSRMGMDMERSTRSTVAERDSASVSTTSKSSGVSRTGTPEPPRRTALCTVVERWRLSGSPYS